jgi:1-acyl-sn-glycerol-3-phosphate acyltransferase
MGSGAHGGVPISVRRFLHTLALYAFHVLIARPVLFGIGAVRFRRRHLVPEGPCLVVSNHNSHLDAAVLMTMFPLRRLRHVHPVAAADYFGSSWWKRAMAMLLMNGVPIERRPGRGKDPLTPVIDRLKAGESLIFFPEGSRGEAGVVAPFRRGIGLLVQAVPGLLVVPVFLSGPERIWPRGEVVPVPLNIDAHVGRPRTYPVEWDAREIAEKVREDVLSLAPPPPPIPGRRPTPPTRVAFCSTDAESRIAAFRAVTERLGRIGPTLGVAEPVMEADEGGMREAKAPIAVQPLRFWLNVMAWVFRASSRFRKEEFAGLVACAQIDEALDHGSDTRFAVVEDSPLVDFVAFQGAAPDREGLDEAKTDRLIQFLTGGEQIPVTRNPWFIRKAPEIWLINVFDLVRTPVPDILVHLRVPGAKVMERLRSRGARLRAFDNMEALDRLDASYASVAEVLRRRHHVEVLGLEGSDTDPFAVADRVEAAVRRRAGQAETG